MSALTKELNKSAPARADQRSDKARAKGAGPQRAQDAPGKAVASFSPNERLLFCFQALIGQQVRVQVKTGTVYTGIFHTANALGKDLDIVLKYAKVLDPEAASKAQSAQTFIKTLKIYGSDLVQCNAVDVRLGPADLDFSGARDAETFSTDADISRTRARTEGRELQRWVPSDSEVGDSLEALPAPGQGGGPRSSRGWNQFQVNQDKFGVTTSFDESIYTSKMDVSKSKYSQADAARLAAEIEGQSIGNAHLAEERGMELENEQADEETLYSSVARDSTTGGTQATQDAGAGASAQDVASNDRLLENGNSGSVSQAAWSNAGSGVAAISNNRPQNAGRGEQVRGRSQPIAVDPRREHNKVRLQLTQAGPRGSSTSPYGTPQGLSRSPLASPLVGNASQVEALDLNPGTAKFDHHTRKEFLAFKAQQQRGPGEAAESSKQASAPLQAEPSSSAASFSTEEASRNRGAASRPSSASLADKAAVPPDTPPAPTAAAKPGTKASPGVPRSGGSRPAAAPRTPAGPAAASTPPRGGAPAGAGTPTLPSTSSSSTPSTTKSVLNPNAKSFSFNPNASLFVPGASSRPATAAATPSGSGEVPARVSSAASAGPPTATAADGRPATAAASSSLAATAGPRMHRAGSSAAGSQGSDGPTQGSYREHGGGPRAGSHHKHPSASVGQQMGPGASPQGDSKPGRGPQGPVPLPIMSQHMMAQSQRMGGSWMPQQTFLQPRPFVIPGSPQQQVMFVARPGMGGPANGSSFMLQGGGMPFPVMYGHPGMGPHSNGVMRPTGMFAPAPFGMPLAGMPGPGMQMSQQMAMSGDMLMGQEALRRGPTPQSHPHHGGR